MTGTAATIALIVAAGRGSRLGGEMPKQYRRLAGEPLLCHSARAFLEHPQVDAVAVVIHPDDRALYDAAVGGLPLLAPIAGGSQRQESVRLGLDGIESRAPERVLIHDAARPFVSLELISRVLAALETAPGALPGLPMADSLKRGEGGIVTGSVARDDIYRAQTPQGFRFAEILAAHRAAAGQSLTDDAAVAEAANLDVVLVSGDPANEKITTAADLAAAESRLAAARETRIGQGFDVHRFGQGASVTLCGIEISHNNGLIGHSDADVALHALTDAILGALSEGDIGRHFPPSDPQWKDAPSHLFLEHAAKLAAGRGGRILQVDLTVICEVPKIGPHREAMRERVANILGISLERVSVKATTTEGLGFTGRGEGIAAQAIATLSLPVSAP